jgi:hypothetical protein
VIRCLRKGCISPFFDYSFPVCCGRYLATAACTVTSQQMVYTPQYHSSWRTSSSYFKDAGGGRLLLNLVSKTNRSGSLLFKCGDCAGQGRCLNSSAYSSNHDWTVPAVWRGHCRLWNLRRYVEITSGSWDALITQPDHVLPYSNSPMMGNNGANKILYHDIPAQTTTELIIVSLLESGIPDCRLPWVFSKRKLFLM